MKRYLCSLVALGLLQGVTGPVVAQPTYAFTTFDVPGSSSFFTTPTLLGPGSNAEEHRSRPAAVHPATLGRSLLFRDDPRLYLAGGQRALVDQLHFFFGSSGGNAISLAVIEMGAPFSGTWM
jgi:hypothetical protein